MRSKKVTQVCFSQCLMACRKTALWLPVGTKEARLSQCPGGSPPPSAKESAIHQTGRRHHSHHRVHPHPQPPPTAPNIMLTSEVAPNDKGDDSIRPHPLWSGRCCPPAPGPAFPSPTASSLRLHTSVLAVEGRGVS